MHDLSALMSQFADPPREFGMMPQWFWNDDVEEHELLGQLRDFYAKGCGGIMPHPRIGLSRKVGYLTPEYFRLIRAVVAEAARLGMKVVLYDEGSYPSGSAQGQVVAENPAWANRCLVPFRCTIEGPARGFWRPNSTRYLCDRLVAAVAGRVVGTDRLDPTSLMVLSSPDGELVPYDLGEGTWELVAAWNVLSGATIRGVFEEEDDEHSLAPAAADILNPAAVESFIRHTHEHYREAIGDYFGTTVVAIFIDEPGLLGRGPRRGGRLARPYTAGFLDDLREHWDDDVKRWLPALWLDCGVAGAAFRAAYDEALLQRQRRVFYGPISRWCARYGLALTGHPPRSDESTAQRLFQWPGQDMVWWYVAPENERALGDKQNTALVGEHSTAPKGAHSMALLGGRRFTSVEVFGAYGWHLTLDTVKWLIDWHLIRGINLFFPHAFFYSVRGRRAFESEPDLGIHNLWWPYWRGVADYVRRLCWLFTDAQDVCGAAILCDPDNLPWHAAQVLYERQIPFLYIGPDALAGSTIRDGQLCLGEGGTAVSLVIVDPPDGLHTGSESLLKAFSVAGGSVISAWTPDTLPALLPESLTGIPRWHGPPALRLRVCRRGAATMILAINEGEEEISGQLDLPAAGQTQVWDPLTGEVSAAPAAGVACSGTGPGIALTLSRRQGVVIALGPTTPDHVVPAVLPDVPGMPRLRRVLRVLDGAWEIRSQDGESVQVAAPGDWSRQAGWELFAGTLIYQAVCEFSSAEARQATHLDLGQVGDIAELMVNGHPLGFRAWAPYVFAVGETLVPGSNRIEVRVTNSLANRYYGRQRPSGLLGPLRLLAQTITAGPPVGTGTEA